MAMTVTQEVTVDVGSGWETDTYKVFIFINTLTERFGHVILRYNPYTGTYPEIPKNLSAHFDTSGEALVHAGIEIANYAVPTTFDLKEGELLSDGELYE